MPTAVDCRNDEEKTKQASGSSKVTTTRQCTNASMVQNNQLIWLDNNIDEQYNDDCRNRITQVGHVVNTFTDSDQCVTFLSEMTDDKVCMIISGSLGQYIVPLIHDMSQMDSIFIFCGNKKRHEEWTNEWPKIKGVFTEISPICEALKQAAQHVIPTSSVSDQLDCSFMYTQLFKENRNKTPPWRCFLYSMLNRALRINDVDIIIKMEFFIRDLYHHVKQLHYEQFDGDQQCQIFTVYRGQALSQTYSEPMMKTKGGLMAFNKFLSTSKVHQVSHEFSPHVLSNPCLVRVLLVITIDFSISIISINNVSPFEDKFLLRIHIVFRILEVKRMSENNCLRQLELTLTCGYEKELRSLAELIREETFSDLKEWYQLSSLLVKPSQSDKTQQINLDKAKTIEENVQRQLHL